MKKQTNRNELAKRLVAILDDNADLFEVRVFLQDSSPSIGFEKK